MAFPLPLPPLLLLPEVADEGAILSTTMYLGSKLLSSWERWMRTKSLTCKVTVEELSEPHPPWVCALIHRP